MPLTPQQVQENIDAIASQGGTKQDAINYVNTLKKSGDFYYKPTEKIETKPFSEKIVEGGLSLATNIIPGLRSVPTLGEETTKTALTPYLAKKTQTAFQQSKSISDTANQLIEQAKLSKDATTKSNLLKQAGDLLRQGEQVSQQGSRLLGMQEKVVPSERKLLGSAGQALTGAAEVALLRGLPTSKAVEATKLLKNANIPAIEKVKLFGKLAPKIATSGAITGGKLGALQGLGTGIGSVSEMEGTQKEKVTELAKETGKAGLFGAVFGAITEPLLAYPYKAKLQVMRGGKETAEQLQNRILAPTAKQFQREIGETGRSELEQAQRGISIISQEAGTKKNVLGQEKSVIKDWQSLWNKAKELKNNSWNTLDKTLKSLKGRYNSKDATDALNIVKEKMTNIPGMSNELKEVNNMLKIGRIGYSPSELNQAKQLISKYGKLFEGTDNAVKEGLKNVRFNIKTQIEDIAKEQGKGDIISQLNNRWADLNSAEELVRAQYGRSQSQLSKLQQRGILDRLANGISRLPIIKQFITDPTKSIISGLFRGLAKDKTIPAYQLEEQLSKALVRLRDKLGDKVDDKALQELESYLTKMFNSELDDLIQGGKKGLRYLQENPPGLTIKDISKSIPDQSLTIKKPTLEKAEVQEAKKYKTTINIQDKNDLEYLGRILSEDQIKDIKAGKMINFRGTPYEDLARVNIISKTPKTIEQQLSGKIKDVKLKSDTFYHGTSAENASGIMKTGFKRGSELPEKAFRGGGYGKMQNSISFAETPKEASIFSTLSKNGEIVEAKLKPNSRVVSIKGIEDAIDLEDYISYLKKQKVDAVYIGGGEKELVVINPKAITPTKSQPTEIWNQANKVVGRDLISEARKYKSAEEFVKAQGTPVYTGKVGNIELDYNRVAQKGNQLPYGVHFTPDEGIAKSFASGETKGMPTGSKGVVESAIISAKNPFDVSATGNNGEHLFFEGSKQYNILQEIAKRDKLGDLSEIYSKKSGGHFIPKENISKYNDSKLALNPNWILDKAKPETIKSILAKNGYDPVIKYSMRGTKDPLGMGLPTFTDAYAVLDKSAIKTKSKLIEIWNNANKK